MYHMREDFPQNLAMVGKEYIYIHIISLIIHFYEGNSC